jgi:hypothetical protein
VGGVARRSLAPGIRTVARWHRERGVEGLPWRRGMARERGRVGFGGRTDYSRRGWGSRAFLSRGRSERKRVAVRSSSEAGNRESNDHRYFHWRG